MAYCCVNISIVSCIIIIYKNYEFHYNLQDVGIISTTCMLHCTCTCFLHTNNIHISANARKGVIQLVLLLILAFSIISVI